MKVLYVINGLSASGAERSLVEMVLPLRRRGIDVDVCYLYERPGLRHELEALGTSVRRVRSSRAGAVADLARLIRQLRPDVVHTTLFDADITGRVAATLVRTRVVSSLVNVAYGAEHLRAPGIRASRLRVAQLLDASTARLTVRLHAISDHVASVMARRLAFPPDRIDVVRRGRDPERLGSRSAPRRDDARARLGIGADTPMVLAAARQEHQKGLDVLLNAFVMLQQTIPRAKLVVAGRRGAATPRLARLVEELSLDGSVEFLGTVSDVPELLCAADVFVLPSRWEGLGSVLIEAMALETPIVATALPAIEEVVEDGETALLVAPEDAAGVAVAVSAVLKDRRAASEMARRGRRRFEDEFTIERVAGGMATFYKRAVSAPR